MRNLLIGILLCGVGISSALEPIKNPVYGGNAPDPTIWQADDGMYYCCATPGGGRGLILQSKNLVKWESSGKRPFSEEMIEVIHKEFKNIWAPDMIRLNGKWMFYVTLYNSARDSAIAVFSSDNATGPFEDMHVITRSKETNIKDTIDPEVVKDPDTGKLWLFFGSIGKMHRVELKPDGLSVVDNAQYVHVAGLDSDQNRSRSKVYEGCYLYRRDGWWYLFASCGWYNNHTYSLVVGRSKTLDGEFVDKEGKPMKEGNATKILRSDAGDEFYGPGHNGEIITDGDGKTYMFYHCHQASLNKGWLRNLHLQEILWGEDGWPYFETGKPK